VDIIKLQSSLAEQIYYGVTPKKGPGYETPDFEPRFQGLALIIDENYLADGGIRSRHLYPKI